MFVWQAVAVVAVLSSAEYNPTFHSWAKNFLGKYLSEPQVKWVFAGVTTYEYIALVFIFTGLSSLIGHLFLATEHPSVNKTQAVSMSSAIFSIIVLSLVVFGQTCHEQTWNSAHVQNTVCVLVIGFVLQDLIFNHPVYSVVARIQRMLAIQLACTIRFADIVPNLKDDYYTILLFLVGVYFFQAIHNIVRSHGVPWSSTKENLIWVALAGTIAFGLPWFTYQFISTNVAFTEGIISTVVLVGNAFVVLIDSYIDEE